MKEKIAEEPFEVHLFNPRTMDVEEIPNKPGLYIIVLDNSVSLPSEVSMPNFQTTSLVHNEISYPVIYIGKSSKSLRMRTYQQHFNGNAGISTLRKSLGCLMGFSLIARDTHNPQSKKTKFQESDEEKLSKWMYDNLMFFYCLIDFDEKMEKSLINQYNPPLNIQWNTNKINEEYRLALSKLRTTRAGNLEPTQTSQKHKMSISQKRSNSTNSAFSRYLKPFITVFIVMGVIIIYFNISGTVTPDSVDPNATYIITKDFDAPINVDAAKLLTRSAVDGDKLTFLTVASNATVHFNVGDKVQITRRYVHNIGGYFEVMRLSDGQFALIPHGYVRKDH